MALPPLGPENSTVNFLDAAKKEKYRLTVVLMNTVTLVVHGGALLVGFGDCFDRLGSSSRETILQGEKKKSDNAVRQCSFNKTHRNAKFTGYLSGHKFAKCRVELVDADRCKHNRSRNTMTEQSSWKRYNLL